jgi:hypothetical protein
MRTFLLMRYDHPSTPSFLDAKIIAEGVIFTDGDVVLSQASDQPVTIYDSLDTLKEAWVKDGTHFIQFKEDAPISTVKRHFTEDQKQEIIQIVEQHLRRQLTVRKSRMR